jgi:hypothetical protein
MPRLALFNIVIGFAVLTITAAAGAFLATDITTAYVKDQALLGSWSLLLQKSAHGHTNLFGMLHVLFGLTVAYSAFSPKVKSWQTCGLALGTVAMGPMMLVKAATPPVEGYDALGLIMGAALAALASHALGVGLKLTR